MDNERFDQDNLIWDQEPFLEDLTSPPPEPPAAEDDFLDNEFPWFADSSVQGSQSRSPQPPRPPQPPYPPQPPLRSQPRPRSGQNRNVRTADGQPRPGGQRPRSSSRKRRRRRRRSPLKTFFLVLLVLVLCVVAAGAVYYHHVMGKINFEPAGVADSQEDNVKKVDKLTNILLVGEDARLEGETGQRSDSMILCTLNPDTHEVVLTSFMRDMYVPIPGHKKNRINNAFARGGVELLEQTITDNFGVHVDGYVRIDFGGFIQAIAALGNMQMELTEEEAAYMNEHPEYGSEIDWTTDVWNLQPGWNTLTPEQFLCYARMRHVGNSDWERTERQRKVLMTCYQQVKNCGVTKLLSLISTVAPYITTDIQPSDLLSYAYMMAGDGVNNIESFRIPADGTYQMKNINGMEVLVPDIQQNAAMLQEFINNTRSNQDDAAPAEGEEANHMGVVESPPVQSE